MMFDYDLKMHMPDGNPLKAPSYGGYGKIRGKSNRGQESRLKARRVKNKLAKQSRKKNRK